MPLETSALEPFRSVRSIPHYGRDMLPTCNPSADDREHHEVVERPRALIKVGLVGMALSPTALPLCLERSGS